jgi:hypothetical protein
MSNALGAYFGTARIVQGAGGLGAEEFLQAYADGSVGGREQNPEMPGPLTAYHDGSLGRMSHQYGGGDSGELAAWADGVVGGNPPDGSGSGQLFAYHDGSLGAEASPATIGDDISSYHDGVLGDRRNQVVPGFGPLQSFQDGSLGAYARAIGAAAENVLDLGDANVLKELKVAMSLIAPEQTLTPDGQKVYTPDWYTSGIWDPQASLLWQYIVSKTSAFKGKVVSVDLGAQSYPNATGIGFMVAALAAPHAGTYGPDYVKKTFPALYAWFSAGGGTVLPPFLSLTDKTKGVRGAAGLEMSMTTVAFAGLGAVALLGLALMLRKKKS